MVDYGSVLTAGAVAVGATLLAGRLSGSDTVLLVEEAVQSDGPHDLTTEPEDTAGYVPGNTIEDPTGETNQYVRVDESSTAVPEEMAEELVTQTGSYDPGETSVSSSTSSSTDTQTDTYDEPTVDGMPPEMAEEMVHQTGGYSY